MMLPIMVVRVVMPHPVFPNAGDDEHAVRHLKNCGLSTQEIADRMGVSKRTVQRCLS